MCAFIRVFDAGLTCTEQNFITKSGFQQFAAKHGVIVVAPDTSPRTLHCLSWCCSLCNSVGCRTVHVEC